MLKADVLEFFKTRKHLSEALRLASKGSVSQWGTVIPEKRALQLEKLTGGELKYDPELYRNR